MRAHIEKFKGESIDTEQWKTFLYEYFKDQVCKDLRQVKMFRQIKINNFNYCKEIYFGQRRLEWMASYTGHASSKFEI